MASKRKKFRKTAKKQNYFSLILLGSAVILSLLLIPLAMPVEFRPLTPLSVPKHLAQLTYTDPLTLTHLNTSVLGAQTIDPVDFVNDINLERAKVGSPALRLNTTLMRAAAMRVGVILKYQNFSHLDPHEGVELGTVLPKLNYNYVYATENIGMGGLSAADFVNGFMSSAMHKSNLLDPLLTETGAAIGDGPYQQYYVNIAVQIFAVPGGVDESRGYSTKDLVQYEEAETYLSDKLNPLRLLAQQILRNPEYTDTRVKNYIRQKEILEKLLARMRNNEPLENPDVALILEFNSLL